MNNYIVINGQKIELTAEQIEQIVNAQTAKDLRLGDIAPDEVIKIGDFELVILAHKEDKTVLILKDMYGDDTEFGKNNRYEGSYVDDICNEFADAIANIVGEENIILHEVDLISDDGLKDYGKIERRASLLTAEMYRKFVDILDHHNPEKWWWLATPHSTARHKNESWVKCVAPSGFMINRSYISDFGVRPFCILNSSISVSLGE